MPGSKSNSKLRSTASSHPFNLSPALFRRLPQRYRAMVILLAHSGLRIDELAELDWRDIEFSNEVGERTVPIGHSKARRSPLC